MIKNAVDNEYLTEYLDNITFQINQPLHEVLTSLFTLYGKVRRTDLKILEREVENTNYDLSQPPSVLWKAINDLQNLAKAAKQEYSDDQLVLMGLTLIQSTHDFEKVIDEWVDRPSVEHTYSNLKTHFNEAYTKLQRIRGDDMLQSSQHHANAMRMDINVANAHLQEEMIANVATLKEDIIAAIADEKKNQPPIEQAMNAATTVDALSKLTSVIASLEKRINQVERSCLQPNNNNNHSNKNDPNYDIPFWLKADNKFKYCWSCGSNATHNGSECNRKRDGHIDNATFSNRQGGSFRRIPKRFQNM